MNIMHVRYCSIVVTGEKKQQKQLSYNLWVSFSDVFSSQIFVWGSERVWRNRYNIIISFYFCHVTCVGISSLNHTPTHICTQRSLQLQRKATILFTKRTVITYAHYWALMMGSGPQPSRTIKCLVLADSFISF